MHLAKHACHIEPEQGLSRQPRYQLHASQAMASQAKRQASQWHTSAHIASLCCCLHSPYRQREPTRCSQNDQQRSLLSSSCRVCCCEELHHPVGNRPAAGLQPASSGRPHLKEIEGGRAAAPAANPVRCCSELVLPKKHQYYLWIFFYPAPSGCYRGHCPSVTATSKPQAHGASSDHHHPQQQQQQQ